MRLFKTLVCSLAIASCTSSSNDKISDDPASPMLGERIDGPANIRDSANGMVLFELKDDVLVEAGKANNGWQKAGSWIRLSAEEQEWLRILPDRDLFDEAGNKIGRTKDTVDVYGASDDHIGLISGYTSVRNIKVNTIPERVLCHEIMKGHRDEESLGNFMESFRFDKADMSRAGGYHSRTIYESAVDDPSPLDRITLLFNKEEKLVAIIHSRKLTLKNVETFELNVGHQLTVFGELTKDQVQNLILAQNHFYSSVD